MSIFTVWGHSLASFDDSTQGDGLSDAAIRNRLPAN